MGTHCHLACCLAQMEGIIQWTRTRNEWIQNVHHVDPNAYCYGVSLMSHQNCMSLVFVWHFFGRIHSCQWQCGQLVDGCSKVLTNMANLRSENGGFW